jgi:hypothetical protein
MADHPTSDLLLALADGDRLGADFGAVSEHVANCADCKTVVMALQQVKTAVYVAGADWEARDGKHTWAALSARIVTHRWRHSRIMWTAGLAAAALVMMTLVHGSGRVVMDTRPAIRPAAPASEDAAVATVERTLERWQTRLSPSELRAANHVVDGVDLAIRQTREELAKDPGNAFLRDHLVQLRRKRISALETFVNLARDRA